MYIHEQLRKPTLCSKTSLSSLQNDIASFLLQEFASVSEIVTRWRTSSELVRELARLLRAPIVPLQHYRREESAPIQHGFPPQIFRASSRR